MPTGPCKFYLPRTPKDVVERRALMLLTCGAVDTSFMAGNRSKRGHRLRMWKPLRRHREPLRGSRHLARPRWIRQLRPRQAKELYQQRRRTRQGAATRSLFLSRSLLTLGSLPLIKASHRARPASTAVIQSKSRHSPSHHSSSHSRPSWPSPPWQPSSPS
jgi:hypothetical protein